MKTCERHGRAEHLARRQEKCQRSALSIRGWKIGATRVAVGIEAERPLFHEHPFRVERSSARRLSRERARHPLRRGWNLKSTHTGTCDRTVASVRMFLHMKDFAK